MLEPKADGFRNYLRAGEKLSPETLLVDRAYMACADAKKKFAWDFAAAWDKVMNLDRFDLT